MPDDSAGTKTWSWSGELFGGQKATPTETGTAMKLQQFEETGGPVGDEMVSMMDVKGEEVQQLLVCTPVALLPTRRIRLSPVQ